MRLKQQLLALFFLAATVAVLVGLLFILHILNPTLEEYEDDAARRELSRVEAVFLQTFSRLSSRVRDWSGNLAVVNWSRGDGEPPAVPAYPASRLDISAAWLVSPEGETHWLRGGGMPEAEAIYQTFRDRGCDPYRGVALLGEVPHMFAVQPVGACGAAVFAVAMDQQLARALSSIVALNIMLRPGQYPALHRIERIDAGTIRAGFPVIDYRGSPVLRVEAELPRHAYQRGREMALFILAAILAVSLVAAAILYLFIRQRIFHRLALLHRAVRRIARRDDLSQRVNLVSGDEFGDLARDFNAMVDHMVEVQQSLARERERAEAANRAKSLFLANMSHEIRTPMTAILGYTELLQKPALSAEERDHYLQIIQQNGDALLALINDILDLSRIEAGQLHVKQEPCDLSMLMKDVINCQSLRARQKGIQLELAFQGAVPRMIVTDAFRLRQVLINLVSNAVKFTDEGCVQTIVTWDREEERLAVQVIDTGIGIPPEALDTIFEPFSQVDASHTRRYGGTGLGLAISRELCRFLGGEISARSTAGEGSTFTLQVRAPAADDDDMLQPSLAQCAKRQDAGKVPASGRVLVVEDNQVNRLLVMRILSHAGYAVYEAADGREALEMIEARGNFDLVVLDMQMPVLDGYGTARTLRQQGFESPILALTANVMAEDQRRCLDAGCDAFLGKPVRAQKLLETCTKLLEDVSVRETP